MTFNATQIILASILVANFVFAIVVVFYERKRPSEMLAWLLLFVFLPVIGFLLYMLIGQKFFKRNRRLLLEPTDERRLHEIIDAQTQDLMQRRNEEDGTWRDEHRLIYLNLTTAAAPLTTGNSVMIFKHGTEKFHQLFIDIAAAKQSIHLEYFIWRGNDLGRRLVEALAKKADEGVAVRVILDDWGCKLTPKAVFAPLVAAGGSVHRFLPVNPVWAFNANYRNHRKIVVIDGEIGYTGGMNVGDEYLGLRPSTSPWRDTHIRIVGPAVKCLQRTFLMNYRYVSGEDLVWADVKGHDETPGQGTSDIQIVTSGPDSTEQHVKQAFLKMISLARESVYVQTPYLVPDESLLAALKLASFSGVDVRIMIPGISNNTVVHRVTRAYAGELLEAGVRIYEYRGFLHSKCMAVDRHLLTIGTTNMDIRSFAHNFEVNAFIYDPSTVTEFRSHFRDDMANSDELSLATFNERGLRERFFESVYRLFAPLM